jgi:hypothetical protein
VSKETDIRGKRGLQFIEVLSYLGRYALVSKETDIRGKRGLQFIEVLS